MIQKKFSLALASFIILGVLMIVFLIIPLQKEIKKNAQDLTSIKEERVNLENKIQNIEDFRENYRQIKPDLDKVENLFIEPKVPLAFIGFLEKLSRDCQLSMSIVPTASPISKNIKEIWPFLSFQINSAGSFSNTSKFLEKLENNPYLIQIQDLNLSKALEKDSTSSNDIKTSFLIKVFSK